MDIYFDTIMYLAFQNSLLAEDNRSLSIKQLHTYKEILLKKNIITNELLNTINITGLYSELNDSYDNFVDMSEEKEKECFSNFIKNNNDILKYNNGVITLYDNVSYNMLEKLRMEILENSDISDKYILGSFVSMQFDIEALKSIGIQKAIKYIENTISCEKKIEKAYQCDLLDSDKKLQNEIEKDQKISDLRLALIGNHINEKMTLYQRIIANRALSDEETNGKKITLVSDKLVGSDEYFQQYYAYYLTILYAGLQNAIFDTETLVYSKLDATIDAMWAYRDPDFNLFECVEPINPELQEELNEYESIFSELCEDEFEDDATDEEDIDELEDLNQIEKYLNKKKIDYKFYLNYIDKINKYFTINGNNELLKLSKNRLLYLLDYYGDELYKTENYNKELNNSKSQNINKADFEDFYMISRAFLIDYLEEWVVDEQTIRKLLFVSNYYDLTKDYRIKNIIDKYEGTKSYDTIVSIVLDENYSKLSTLNNKILVRKKKKDNK